MPARVAELQEEIDYLQGCIDEARDTLDEVNTVASTREQLAEAVLAALDALNPEEAEDDEEEDDEEVPE